MHEYHQVEALVKQFLKMIKAKKTLKVNQVTIVLGSKTGYKEGSIRNYFKQLTDHGPARGARLHFIKRTPSLYCENCQSGFSSENGSVYCSSCKALGQWRSFGDEFYIESIKFQNKKLAR